MHLLARFSSISTSTYPQQTPMFKKRVWVPRKTRAQVSTMITAKLTSQERRFWKHPRGQNQIHEYTQRTSDTITSNETLDIWYTGHTASTTKTNECFTVFWIQVPMQNVATSDLRRKLSDKNEQWLSNFHILTEATNFGKHNRVHYLIVMQTWWSFHHY